MKRKLFLIGLFIFISVVVFRYNLDKAQLSSNIAYKYNLKNRVPHKSLPKVTPKELQRFNFFEVENYLQNLFQQLQFKSESFHKARKNLNILSKKGSDFDDQVQLFLKSCRMGPGVSKEFKLFCDKFQKENHSQG